MSTNHHNSSPVVRRIDLYWRLISRCYGHLSRFTRCVIGLAFKLVIIAYFLFCGLSLTLRYGILPNINHYKPEVEHLVSQVVGNPVTIAKIDASWSGLQPQLALSGVVIYDKNKQAALQLPRVAATISWWSVAVGDLRLYTLEIDRPDMEIKRDAEGNFFVAGIPLDVHKNDKGRGADWVFSQPEIIIRDGHVRWNDAKRNAPELSLSGVNLVLHNQWRQHQLALKATPPAEFAGPLDIRADFEHPRFTSKISDVGLWQGVLYADLQNTDLTAWKAYFDYPFPLQKGHGSLRAWLSLDHAKVADFTADITLSDVATQLGKDLSPINLAQVNGRISAREEFDSRIKTDVPTFGAQGYTIALTDFSFRTEDGLVFPATTISESYLPAHDKELEQNKITAQRLDLNTLANFAERLPLPAAERKMLADFSPQGQLKDFSAQWKGAYPDISAYHVKGKFVGLSLRQQLPHPASGNGKEAQAGLPAIPGFANLTGDVDADEHSGSFHLNTEKLKLDLSGYFSDPVMLFDRLNMQADWVFQDRKKFLFRVAKMDFAQGGLTGSLSGQHLMALDAPPGQWQGMIDMSGHLSGLELNQVGHYLPLHTPADVRTWLSGGLAGGVARDVDIKLKGDLAKFPFRTDRPNDPSQGEFVIKGRIEHGKLNYTPGHFSSDGKAPLWPLLEEIDGNIALNGKRLQIDADSGKTHGVPVSNVKAVIPDVWSHDVQLEIDGTAGAPLQDLLGYVNDSPVANWIGHFTEETRAGGNAKLNLKLELPLLHIVDAKAQGILQFAGNNVMLQKGLPPLLGTVGKLEFNEKGLHLNGIQAALLGGTVALSGGSQRDGGIAIKADGNLTADGLRKTFATPAMQRLSEHITGGSRYGVSINIKNHHSEIAVESSLQGLALDFPAPLTKAANETLPLKFELNDLPGDVSTLREIIKISLGTAYTARYERQKTIGKDAAWRMVRGGIGINAPAPQPDSGISANISLNTLNIDAWRSATAAPGATNNTSNPLRDATSQAAPDIAAYLEPDAFAARATELIISGKKLDNVVVGASRQKAVWQANIDSDQVSGYVTWNEVPFGQGIGKVTARLASCIVQQATESGVSDILEGKNTSTQLPSLDIIVENFELANKKLGHVELLANNARIASGREWRISKLLISNPDAELKANGKWTAKSGDNLTNLTYTLEIADAGKLVERFGFANALRGGKGKMEGALSWKGLPFAIDYPSLGGQFQMDIAGGQFLKVDSGAAKLLGVLSLQSLPRRLTLDFRDVFSQGFAFDSVAATATIEQGIAKTDSFKMRGVSATVLIDGSADAVKESTDLHVVVIPEINAGGASLLYAMVNPVIGVGTFLAQLFLRDPLMRSLTHEYRISGLWKDPVVTKLDHKNDVPAASANSRSR